MRGLSAELGASERSSVAAMFSWKITAFARCNSFNAIRRQNSSKLVNRVGRKQRTHDTRNGVKRL